MAYLKPTGWAYTKEKGYSYIDPVTGEIARSPTQPELEGEIPADMTRVPTTTGEMYMPAEDTAIVQATIQRWGGTAEYAKEPKGLQTPGSYFQLSLNKINQMWLQAAKTAYDLEIQKALATGDPFWKSVAEQEYSFQLQNIKGLLGDAERKFYAIDESGQLDAAGTYEIADKILSNLAQKMPVRLPEIPASPAMLGGKPAPMGERQALDALYDLKQTLGDIKALYKTKYSGLVDYYAGKIKARTGILVDPKQVAFNQLLSTMIDIAYAKSGKQISEREMEILKERTPNITLSDTAFKVQMDTFMYILDNMIGGREQSLEASGFRPVRPPQAQALEAQPFSEPSIPSLENIGELYAR